MAPLGLKVGSRLVLRLRTAVQFRSQGEVRAGELQGEAALQVEETASAGAALQLVRLGLYGPGYQEAGSVSIRGLEGRAELRQGTLELGFTAGVTYNALERSQFTSDPSVDFFAARREIFAGRLHGQLGERQPTAFRLDQLSLRATHQFLGLIDGVEQSYAAPASARIFDLGVPLPCPEALRRSGRLLRLRAVFLKDHQEDPGTGAEWQRKLRAAAHIWGKCGILLREVRPPVIRLVSPEFKQGEPPRDLVKSYDDKPGVILIFFVAGKSVGGGWTYAAGAAHARCIISDQAVGNFNILAHELGHVLDGDHPGFYGSTMSWAGDPCTVLVQNGSLHVPNLSANTLRNCKSAKSDAICETRIRCIDPDPLTLECP